MKFLLTLLISLSVAFGSYAQTTEKPNIIFILVDDFSMNLMPRQDGGITGTMPNLLKMQKEGMTFDNYFVTDSLCCPSRSSILTGLMPHNSKVFTNIAPLGGYNAYVAAGNDAKSFGLVMQQNNYLTGLFGKYLNGYLPGMAAPIGWTQWASANKGYVAYNFAMNYNNQIIYPTGHMTDVISDLAIETIASANGQPFILTLATFSPHAPYTPPTRYLDYFADSVYPKTPAFNSRPTPTDPLWLQELPALGDSFLADIETKYRKRLQAVKGIDDMIGRVKDKLVELGIEDNTYIIFTSDNGYHMGERSLRPGKQTPFDMDINVPLVITGPGVLPDSKNKNIVMNIDFFPTFLDLASIPIPEYVDGHSIVPLLNKSSNLPRKIAVVEHTNAEGDDVDVPDGKLGAPPTYIALRSKTYLYVRYVTGEIGFYDLVTDPYELNNIASTLTVDQLAKLDLAATENATCSGNSCRTAQSKLPF